MRDCRTDRHCHNNGERGIRTTLLGIAHVDLPRQCLAKLAGRGRPGKAALASYRNFEFREGSQGKTDKSSGWCDTATAGTGASSSGCRRQRAVRQSRSFSLRRGPTNTSSHRDERTGEGGTLPRVCRLAKGAPPERRDQSSTMIGESAHGDHPFSGSPGALEAFGGSAEHGWH